MPAQVQGRLKIATLGFVAMALATVAARAEEKQKFVLRYQFAPDQVLHYTIAHKMVLTTRKGDFPETARNESHIWNQLKVVSVDDDGSATLELTIDRAKMAARFNDGETISVDTNAPDDCPAPYRGVLTSVGKPLARVKLSSNGDVLDAERLKAADTPATNGSGQDENADDRNPLIAFPEDALAIGESWHDDLEVFVTLSRTLRQPVTLRRKYTLEAVENDVARIRLETAILTPVREPTVQAQLIQRTPAGMIHFDLKKGAILSRSWTTDETVIGALGAGSSMQAWSRRVETLLTAEEAKTQASVAQARSPQ